MGNEPVKFSIRKPDLKDAFRPYLRLSVACPSVAMAKVEGSNPSPSVYVMCRDIGDRCRGTS